MVPLTTPVAYITTLPHDPFNSEKNPVYSMVGPFYTWQDLVDIYYYKLPTWGGGYWLPTQIAKGKMWSLSSPGPDLRETMCEDATAIYDPTNGTVSRGDIYRLGP